jgi:DNA-3-methyladenine glycosylase I
MNGRRVVRCPWCGDDPLYVEYHDREWGTPSFDERYLFEMLILEGAQAGLAWITILRKREGYRRALDGFDPAKIARYDERRKVRLLADAGIVRNRAKVDAAVVNARAYLELRERGGSLAALALDAVGGAPRRNAPRAMRDVPAKTAASDALSTELRHRGFKFVGSTIVYAWMQAVGVVDDHLVGCFRKRELDRLRRATRPGG